MIWHDDDKSINNYPAIIDYKLLMIKSFILSSASKYFHSYSSGKKLRILIKSYFGHLCKNKKILKLKFGHSDYLPAVHLQVITPCKGTATVTIF